MKRLLLSTALILGTLTGVSGAALPTTTEHDSLIQASITEVNQRVEQLSKQIKLTNALSNFRNK